jgi:methionyl-tRNA formyltransferase
LAQCEAELLVVAAYGLILPKSVLAIPPRGCLNVHASLLPRWRGAAPIQRAILAGDRETGVDIMKMEAGLDTGPVLMERRVSIGDAESAGMLKERLAEEGAHAIVEALANLEVLEEKQQSTDGVTYAAKIEKAEAVIDWHSTAVEVSRRIRAFNPFPGAVTRLAGETLKIWEAVVVDAVNAPPGTVVGARNGAPLVACGTGGLALTQVQLPGSRRMPGADFLKGRALPPGTMLG